MGDPRTSFIPFQYKHVHAQTNVCVMARFYSHYFFHKQHSFAMFQLVRVQHANALVMPNTTLSNKS